MTLFSVSKRNHQTQRPLLRTKNSVLAKTTAHVTRTPGRPALFARRPVATLGHTAPPCRSDSAGMRTCGIPYALGMFTPPCSSAVTLAQVRTSTSCSFGWKTASTFQFTSRELSLPTFVKSASIGGLKIAMDWSSTAINFICVFGSKVRKSFGLSFSAYRSCQKGRRIFNCLLPCGVHQSNVLDERLFLLIGCEPKTENGLVQSELRGTKVGYHSRFTVVWIRPSLVPLLLTYKISQVLLSKGESVFYRSRRWGYHREQMGRS